MIEDLLRPGNKIKLVSKTSLKVRPKVEEYNSTNLLQDGGPWTGHGTVEVLEVDLLSLVSSSDTRCHNFI